ncbi:MAG: hypothetical protein ACRD0K_21820 [Egibacteraceae bacterium]
MAYADTALEELKTWHELDRRAEPTLPSHDVASSDDDGSRVPQSERVWLGRIEAASAFRRAGQWAMLIDPDRARQLLARAGLLFQDLGHPYGMYLRVVAGDWAFQAPHEPFREAIDQLAQLHGQAPPFRNTPRPISPPLYHAQQQAYLVLACAASQPIREEYGRILAAVGMRSPHRFGVTPVGALGTPIRRLWSVALALLGEPEPTPPSFIFRHIIAMSRSYAEVIESAMVNEYLWWHAASPVEVGDVEISGMVACMVYRFGHDTVQAVLDENSELDNIARAPVELGIELAGPGEDNPWTRRSSSL